MNVYFARCLYTIVLLLCGLLVAHAHHGAKTKSKHHLQKMKTQNSSDACHFPPGFQLGTATSAYQIEGAWNVSGKTPSVWDVGTHDKPWSILDGSNGDIACDSYNQLDVDIKNLKLLNVSFYRFSISWPRLLPEPLSKEVSKEGLRYYNEVIDKLIANNIEPMATIFHWDLPQSLQELGGWTSRIIIDHYLHFARTCFQLFGDRVKIWVTFNEIKTYCVGGYEAGKLPPYAKSPGVGTYLCGHYQLLAHGMAYRMYQNEFKHQKGEIGMAMASPWYFPATDSAEDKKAADIAIAMSLDWFAHPIFSAQGGYPPLMSERIDRLSQEEGLVKSRLPKFTQEEIVMLKGSSDFFGLNHYNSLLTAQNTNRSANNSISYLNDINVVYSADKSWKGTARTTFKITPTGLSAILVYIKQQYNNPPVYITENGYAGFQNEDLNDKDRIYYLTSYLTQMLKAINDDKCDVRKYTFWSFMDNFEWPDGYTLRFGLFHVDFDSTDRIRTPKQSVQVYREIIRSGSICNVA